MVDVQNLAAVIFLILLALFLYMKRDKLKIQKIAFPLFYFVMYRTKHGLRLMDRISKRFPKTVRYSAYVGVVIGFIGMLFMSWLLVVSAVKIFTAPAAQAGVALVLPIKIKGGFYVPFFYWIISIFVLAIVHEFCHGVVSTVHKIKVKSSGFAFLGIIIPIIPAAFVEPDEQILKKRPVSQKLSVFAAGPFANIITAGIIMLILSTVFAPLATAIVKPDGITVAGYIEGEDSPILNSGVKEGDIIRKINGKEVTTIDNFTAILRDAGPGDYITISTNDSAYIVELGENPENSSKPYLGVYVKQNTRVNPAVEQKYGKLAASAVLWVLGLFYWMYLLNLGIGLFNLVPMGPLDGGRMLHAVLSKYFKEKTANRIWKLVSLFFLIIIIASVAYGFLR